MDIRRVRVDGCQLMRLMDITGGGVNKYQGRIS